MKILNSPLKESNVVSVKDKVIDALGIPNLDTIKEALKLPNYQDVIDREFSVVPDTTDTDYMLKCLNLNSCINRIAEKYSFGDSIINSMKEALRDELPTAENVVNNFTDSFPSKEEIINLIDIPTKEDLLSQLSYPVTAEQLSSILPNVTNREVIKKTFNIITKSDVIQKLDEWRQETTDISTRTLIDNIKSLVPENITSECIQNLIPDGDVKNSLLQSVTSEILMPVKNVVDMLEIPDKNQIVDAISSIGDNVTKDIVLDKIPNIQCKQDIENLYKTVITPIQDVFDSFNIPDQNTIYEKLNIEKIVSTYELPQPSDVLSSLNLPDQTDIVKAFKNSIPDASDIISSLNIPPALDLCQTLFDKIPQIESQMKPYICSIFSEDMIQNVSLLQDKMNLQSRESIITNLMSSGFLPTSQSIIQSLHLPTYGEMAAKLNIATDSKFILGMRRYLASYVDFEKMVSGDDIQFTRETIEALLNSINPKAIIEAIGEETYKRVSEIIDSAVNSVDDVVEFYKTGNLPL